MQTGFLKLCGIFQGEEGIDILKQEIKKMYSKKGDKVVQVNINGVDIAKDKIIEIKYDREKWLKKEKKPYLKDRKGEKVPGYISEYVDYLSILEGDKLPVSAFSKGEGVLLPTH